MITEDRIDEITASPRTAYIMGAEIAELVTVYRKSKELLHQIDIGDFVDSNGHSAKMLKPVRDLMLAML